MIKQSVLMVLVVFAYPSWATANTVIDKILQRHDYNDTLQSDILTNRAFVFSAILANLGCYSLSGTVFDFDKKEFKIIGMARTRSTQIEQARKLRRLAQAFGNTNNDTFKLAGKHLAAIASYVSMGDVKNTKHQVILYYSFFVEDIKLKPSNNDQDQQLLDDMGEGIIDDCKSSFAGLGDSLKKQALEALNLQSF